MHITIKNLNIIKDQLKLNLNDITFKNLKIIAVSKTFPIEKMMPLIDFGHIHFGENKVQETINKWSNIKEEKSNIKLHLIGKLQSNKVKLAVNIFDYIHSLDSEKLANKIATEEEKNKKKIKLFIQVNIGDEKQKSGIEIEKLDDFYKYCLGLNLNVIGLMCIPPQNIEAEDYFKKMEFLNKKYNFKELSMGMSADYLKASKYSATYLRIGSNIFGKRS